MNRRLRRWLIVLAALVILVGLFLIPGGAKQQSQVADEFNLHPLIRLPKIGPLDFSITKAVACLWIATALIAIGSLVVSRVLKPRPGRFQTAVESIYELARRGIAGSVMREGVDTWFPYIGSVFIFVLVCNLIGLVPLPFGDHHQLAFYAATGNLNVTIGLALLTFVFTHYAGIRKKGFAGYVGGWMIPTAPPVLRQFIFVTHIVSEFFRLVSLSVRLFANMLAGHAILAVFFAMALLFQSYLIAAVLQVGSTVLFLFEIFVAFIQAFIFAILSAVYMSGALEEEH
jgi:F-type H+-transporting ATPase subunit a